MISPPSFPFPNINHPAVEGPGPHRAGQVERLVVAAVVDVPLGGEARVDM